MKKFWIFIKIKGKLNNLRPVKNRTLFLKYRYSKPLFRIQSLQPDRWQKKVIYEMRMIL